MGLGDFPVDSHAIQIVTKHCEMEKIPNLFYKAARILYQNLTKMNEKENYRPV